MNCKIEFRWGFLEYMLVNDYAEITNIEVNEIVRGEGRGSTLMETFLIMMDRRGVKEITLEVRVDNLIAISLYEKFGFEQVSIRKGYYNSIDGLLMKLELK